jgi:hypothetical protein
MDLEREHSLIARLKGISTSEKALILIIAVLLLSAAFVPTKFVDPDDRAYYIGMKAYSDGKLTLTDAEMSNYTVSLGTALTGGGTNNGSNPNGVVPTGGGTNNATGMRGSYNQWDKTASNTWVIEKTPGYSFILAGFYRLGIAAYTNLILAAIFLPIFYILAKRQFGERTTVFATILMAFSAAFLGMLVRPYMSDFAGFVFVALSVLFYAESFKNARPTPLFLAGLFAGISLCIRYTNGILFLVLIAHLVISNRKSLKTIIKPLTWLAAGSAIPVLLLVAYNLLVFGKIFASGYSYAFGVNFAFQYVYWGQIDTALAIISQNISNLPSFLLRGYPLLILLPFGIWAYGVRRSGNISKDKWKSLLILLFCGFFLLYGQYEWSMGAGGAPGALSMGVNGAPMPMGVNGAPMPMGVNGAPMPSGTNQSIVLNNSSLKMPAGGFGSAVSLSIGPLTVHGFSQAAYSELARFYLPCLLPLALFGGVFLDSRVFKGGSRIARAMPYGILLGIVVVSLVVFYLDCVLRTLV